MGRGTCKLFSLTFFFFPWTVEYYPKFIHALLAADQVLMTASKRP